MRKIVAYFSPTGGTENVAKLIANELQAELMDITVFSYDLSFQPDDLLFFCFPVYGGRIPAPLYDRLSNLNGSETPAAMVAVFGNRAVEDAMLEMSDLCASRGFITVGGIEMVAPHSLDKRFGAGRPDEKDVAELREFLAQLLKKENKRPVRMPGRRPYVEYKGPGMRPVAGSKCTGCGTCSQECPTGALAPEDPKHPLKDRCIGCMRCVSVCPFDNRSLPLPMKLAASSYLSANCLKRKPVQYFL